MQWITVSNLSLQSSARNWESARICFGGTVTRYRRLIQETELLVNILILLPNFSWQKIIWSQPQVQELLKQVHGREDMRLVLDLMA